MISSARTWILWPRNIWYIRTYILQPFIKLGVTPITMSRWADGPCGDACTVSVLTRVITSRHLYSLHLRLRTEEAARSRENATATATATEVNTLTANISIILARTLFMGIFVEFEGFHWPLTGWLCIVYKSLPIIYCRSCCGFAANEWMINCVLW